MAHFVRVLPVLGPFCPSLSAFVRFSPPVLRSSARSLPLSENVRNSQSRNSVFYSLPVVVPASCPPDLHISAPHISVGSDDRANRRRQIVRRGARSILARGGGLPPPRPFARAAFAARRGTELSNCQRTPPIYEYARSTNGVESVPGRGGCDSIANHVPAGVCATRIICPVLDSAAPVLFSTSQIRSQGHKSELLTCRAQRAKFVACREMLGRVCSTGRAEALAAVETLSRQLRKKRRKCKVQACPPFRWAAN